MGNNSDNKRNLKKIFHWPVLGHSGVKEYLQSSIMISKLSHAYLFYGPKNIGKNLITKYFTLSLFCQAQNSEKKPCQSCANCNQINKNIHPDVIIINKDDDKKNINIKQIRLIQQKLSLKSFLISYKIAIIDGAESMTEEASSALLKTLEEPHPKTIFILISDNINNVTSTVTSRCQPISFNLVPSYVIENWLIAKGEEKRNAKIITQMSSGRPGLANSIIENRSIISEKNNRIDLLIKIMSMKLPEKFFEIEKMVNKKENKLNTENTNLLLDEWLFFFRDLLIIKNNSLNITNLSKIEKIKKISNTSKKSYLIFLIDKIVESKKMINSSVNSRLVFENLALSMNIV